MSRRLRTPSGVSVPGDVVKLSEELRHPAPGKVQVRWNLPGVGVSSRTYPDTRAGKAAATKKRKELAGLIAAAAPFDTGTREPVAWSGALAEEQAANADTAQRRDSLLEYARAFLETRWPDVAPRSRGSLIEVFAVAIWAHTDDRHRPDRELSTAFAKEVLPPLTDQAFLDVWSGLAVSVAEAGTALQAASLPVRDLMEVDRIRHLDRVLSTKIDGTEASPGYRRRRRAALNQLLAQAVRDGLLPSNPLAKLPLPKRRRTVKRISQREVVSFAAGEALLAACAADEATYVWTAFFALGLLAGMRPAEIGGLMWGDLTLPEQGWGQARLWVAPQRVSRRVNAGETRSRGPLKWREENEERLVPLVPALVAFLLQHWDHAPEEKRGPADAVFLNTQGNPVNPNDGSRVLRGLRTGVFCDVESPHHIADETHPLRRIVPYSLRHHAATVWLAAGVPGTTVAERLGHSYATLTKVYAGFLRDDRSQDNARIDAWYAEHRQDDVPDEVNPPGEVGDDEPEDADV